MNQKHGDYSRCQKQATIKTTSEPKGEADLLYPNLTGTHLVTTERALEAFSTIKK